MLDKSTYCIYCGNIMQICGNGFRSFIKKRIYEHFGQVMLFMVAIKPFLFQNKGKCFCICLYFYYIFSIAAYRTNSP